MYTAVQSIQEIELVPEFFSHFLLLSVKVTPVHQYTHFVPVPVVSI